MMEPKNYFTFDGVPSTDFKVYCDGSQTFGGPEAALESMEIPGKSGDLLRFGNRYKNVEVAYDCWIVEDMRENLRNLRSFLLSKTTYVKLVDTYHPDEYRLGVFTGGLSPSISHENSLAVFTLTFNCKPQRFFNREPIIGMEPNPSTGTMSTTITNDTYFPSKPLLTISGNGTLTLGGKQIVVKNNADKKLTFDCELMDAYTGEVNRNSDIEISDNGFVTIPPGTSDVKLDGIEFLVIRPRYFYL